MKKKNPLGKSLSEIIAQTQLSKNTDLKIIDDVKNEPIGNNKAKENRAINQNIANQAHLLELSVIGQLLKDKREEKLLSVEYISKNLCLQRSIIESIEQGNWEDLPHIVYVKGYIRKYAELLGNDNQIIPYIVENRSDTIAEKSNNNKNNIKTKHSSTHKRTPKTIYIYSAIIILILGFFIFDKTQKDRSEISKLETAVQVSNNINDVNGKRNIPDFIDTKKLMITCNERTWISVIIDDTEKKEFMLKPQEVVMFNAKDKFDLLIGNAGGVKLILNGKDIGFTGENGQVKRVTLP
jgi:preprotein translocase subunit YajC